MSKHDIHRDLVQTLYKEHGDAIFRYAFYKTSDREKSLDITQETFVKIWESLTGGTIIENHKAYLYRTTERMVIDWYRKKKSLSLDALQDVGYDPSDESGTESTIHRLDAEKVLSHIKDLEPDYRDILLLRYIEGMTVKEIAAILQEKENTVSVRIYRALEKLRAIMKL